MTSTEFFEKAIIIAAHPDDEILWFSSLLDSVEEVVICYLAIKSKPEWTVRRKKSITEYPMENISCLEIDESEFISADWRNPVITKYGIDESKRNIFRNKHFFNEYIKNYFKLKAGLENKLVGCRNVFTHNPWGEYGHAEHIQVYRVVKELQKKMKYNMWCSNYCSNKSYNLMLSSISRFNSEYITLKTNKHKAIEIKDIYVKNRCWSWYKEWEWFNEESFKKCEPLDERTQRVFHTFPLNMIKTINELSRGPKIVAQCVSKISGSKE